MREEMSRKAFLKIAGLAAASFPAAKIVGSVGGHEFLESPVLYGGFTIDLLPEEDPLLYEVDEERFERFQQHNEMFNRRRWDKDFIAAFEAAPQQDEVALKKREAGVPGWSPFAAALNEGVNWLRFNRNANSYGWELDPPQIPPLLDDYSPEEITNKVKVAALFLGASMVGVTETRERWFYKTIGHTPESAQPLVFEDVDLPIKGEEGSVVIPKRMNRVLVLAHETDYDAYLPNGITRLSACSVGQGYSKMAFHTASLAKFIRCLGYQAIPMGNDTALSVPMAIEAGLGEQGRNGILITPKYGPRVRLSKLLTDLPLIVDKPIHFGVKEFCLNCELCADYCPSGCINKEGVFAEPTFETHDINNIVGVKKWQLNQKLCYLYWGISGVGCSNCIACCPFNKPETWLHEATRILIGAESGPLDVLMAKLDHAVGYGGKGEDPDPEAVDFFWNKKREFIHIKKG